MARFDVYRNQSASKSYVPFLLDVQSNLLTELSTRMVVPLWLTSAFGDVELPKQLTPTFDISGRQCLMQTPSMAAVPVRDLGKKVCSLEHNASEIVGAVDFLFQGF